MKWDYTTIEALVTRIQPENDHLDYKRQVDTKSNEVAKDVAAFANTSGGVILYGVIDNGTGVPTKLVGIERDRGNQPIEDWFVNVVKSVSQISGNCYEIHIVDIPDCEDKVLMVVEVKRSPLRPHMVENRFPIRDHRNSRPATISEVRAMYSQSFGRPILSLDIDFLENLNYKPALKLLNVGKSCAFNITGVLFLCSKAMTTTEILSTPFNYFATVPQKSNISILQPGDSAYFLFPDLYKQEPGFLKNVYSAVWIGKFSDGLDVIYPNISAEFPMQQWLNSLELEHVWPKKLLEAPSEEIEIWDRWLASQLKMLHQLL
ncbi:AlbA family DNA-binding domain-containing protein [Sulfoacidibacillus thermotolerans]|uniref:Schlafen AlbA-2 domain-containing protein n=1 Tax=Sulfoacidibacillus thermotolerans TaxID=1765684 RepID=A0A2U3D629_SULT2|nr:ATP-binding protein [Sulfoacidibacillus thermotolerans]PWI56736.1 hypothetical protein BM613_12235 [Sulfoacidibacillus thermotolerans]